MKEQRKQHASEQEFADRITFLQSKLEEQFDASSPVMKPFSSTCKALSSAKDSLNKAKEVVQALDKAKVDEEIIQKAQTVVDACQETVNILWDRIKEDGQFVIESFEQSMLDLQNYLMECTILVQATPKGLADFCAQDEAKRGPLVNWFLSSPEVMKDMIEYGGASNGNWGPAILLYDTLIQDVEENNNITGLFVEDLSDIRYRLVLAVALELATPIAIFHKPDTFVDPKERFWHYLKAYENSELDPRFDTYDVWELRQVINCDAPNDQLQWGRDYLKAYRPDQIWSDDDKWKYVWSVRTDINYRHPEHEFSTYQDLLSAGGQCGARAWFARFITKAFGMPTWGVRQPGHAAMTRWTPKGWITVLGAGFQLSTWTDNRYTGGKNIERNGLDFEEETKARRNTLVAGYYDKLCLWECLAESFGETVEEEIKFDKIWRSLSLVQRRILAEEASESDKKFRNSAKEISDKVWRSLSPEQHRVFAEGKFKPDKIWRILASDKVWRSLSLVERRISFECMHSLLTSPQAKANVDAGATMEWILRRQNEVREKYGSVLSTVSQVGEGCFIIPAINFTNAPSKSLIAMPSYYGGHQLHMSFFKYYEGDEGGYVEYHLPDIIPLGSYLLSCKIVNVHRVQVPLFLTIESDGNSSALVDVQKIDIPYTVGTWEKTDPIEVVLSSPGSTFKFSRPSPCHGLTIKEFILEQK